MKILHVSGPSTGGIASYISQLQRGLAPMGVEANLAPAVALRPGAVSSLVREMKRGGYDLVHCHGFQGGAVGRAAAALAKKPAIVTIHNTLQVGGAVNFCARFAENWLRTRTACWVTVSNFLRNYAWTVLGIPAERTEVVPNGIDLPGEIPSWYSRPTVGIVARLVPTKGVDVFLQAIQLLRPEIPELSAVVIGAGPERDNLEFLCHRLGLGKVVKFMGHRDDVPRLLRQMAVFVLPTRSEGLGISLMEAMALGVPVVATGVGGVPELVRHRFTGLLVPEDDTNAIARSVRQILGDRETAENLRRGAYKHLAENYSTAAMLKRTLQLYGRVLNG